MLTTVMLAATLCAGGRSDYAIAVDTNNVFDATAARELQDIFARSTGVKLAINGAADRKIVIRTDKSLAKNESYVTAEPGGDVVIRGGGLDGSAFGVYHFCEKALGYRIFGWHDGWERIVRTDRVEFAGELHRMVAFDHERRLLMCYQYGTDLSPKNIRRNCGSLHQWLMEKTALYRDLWEEHPNREAGHGFFLYIPCKRYGMQFYKWKENEDFFATHPEWFSMSRDGKRVNTLQLCFSNRELRRKFIERVEERIAQVGETAELTIGANDVPGSFCFCPGCQALEKKYGTPAGAFIDFVPELCAAVKARHPHVLLSTLAYRKQQTENFPKGIERFPDNWVLDFAPVDDDQSQPIGGKGNEKTYENLKKWNAATSHNSYWLYVCMSSAPYSPIRRIQADIRRAYEAGTRGMKICGNGAASVYPLQEYLMLRLTIDPYQDADALAQEYCDFLYGAAADAVMAYFRDLDGLFMQPQPHVDILQTASQMTVYTPELLLKWQKAFAAAAAKLDPKSNEARNLSWVRWDVDHLTLVHWDKVRKANPPAEVDPETIVARMRTVRLPKIYGRPADPAKGVTPTGAYQWQENDYLVAKALAKPVPAELANLPKGVVVHQLPQVGGQQSREDPLAACGRASTQGICCTSLTGAVKRVGFSVYDWGMKKTMKAGYLDVAGIPNDRYVLRKVCTTRLGRNSAFVMDTWWGINASLANYYPEGDELRELEIWGTFRLTGPNCGAPEKDGKDRLWLDRLFLVDRNGPVFKGDGK